MQGVETIALIAGIMTTSSLVAQLASSARNFKRGLIQTGLSNAFLVTNIVGQVLWFVWSYNLMLNTDGERGVFNAVWSSISFALLSVILLFRNEFFMRTLSRAI